MKIVIRVDSSLEIGSGHLMRCMTLAERFREKGHTVTFICRDLVGNMAYLLQERHFTFEVLITDKRGMNLIGYEQWLNVSWQEDSRQTAIILQQEKPDLLIIDHYALDEKWEKKIAPLVKRILVLDDLANRNHYCDFLLDQNYYENMIERYVKRVPQMCTLLLGPEYAILRPEFERQRRKLRERTGEIKRILVFFGGVDLTNQTMKTLQAIFSLNRSMLEIDVIVGAKNPHRKEIELFCQAHKSFSFYCQVDQIAALMAQADLSIGAGGTTTWERCILGLPTIVITIADNQEKMIEDLAKRGVLICLGRNDQVTKEKLVDKIQELIQKSTVLELMQKKCFCLMQENKGVKNIVNIFDTWSDIYEKNIFSFK